MIEGHSKLAQPLANSASDFQPAALQDPADLSSRTREASQPYRVIENGWPVALASIGSVMTASWPATRLVVVTRP